jgi:hypothetical protein
MIRNSTKNVPSLTDTDVLLTHYDVLAAMSKKLNSKMKNTRKLSTTVNSILREEKRHLALCIKLAKQTATS